MARNIKTISQLAHQTAKELNRSPQKWMDCLQTAGRLYQYPFCRSAVNLRTATKCHCLRLYGAVE